MLELSIFLDLVVLLSGNTSLQHLSLLQELAHSQQHRFGVVLSGEWTWQIQVVTDFINTFLPVLPLKVGGESLALCETISFKQARKKLGQETDLLIIDLSDTFDADGFAAVTGTLKGGGLLLFINANQKMTKEQDLIPSRVWLERRLALLPTLTQFSGLDREIVHSHASIERDKFAQQSDAIESIKSVLSGHRKRPLVITADRGRGKSSALGIAASQIINDNPKKIIVTAPNTQAVKTLFDHARFRIKSASNNGFSVHHPKGGQIKYVAPDELLLTKPECDLLLVDEASALPLPILKKIVERYHRVCFSTTVHGYEGCGRGFSLKFESWLSLNRPGWKALRLTHPIRWSLDDPLEAWLFDTFLLDAEIESCCLGPEEQRFFEVVSKQRLLEQPSILRDSFGLLVNAHYQTSPNDLFQLLDDPNLTLFRVVSGSRCIAVVLASMEGALEPKLIFDIQFGLRRPAGHLVPVALCNHLAIDEPALASSLRIMRIAVHPELQRCGIGSWVLNQLHCFAATRFDYLSTSFGVTTELLNFWLGNGFVPVRLGSKQDQASGCYSAMLVSKLDNDLAWIDSAKALFIQQLLDSCSDVHRHLSSRLLFSLLIGNNVVHYKPSSVDLRLVQNYIAGGNSFETSRSSVRSILLGNPSENKAFDAELDLIVSLVFKKLDWAIVADKFGFTGRKQAEQAYRQAVKNLLL
jgi:tRNA(Met) cytidine acetyltransferase